MKRTRIEDLPVELQHQVRVKLGLLPSSPVAPSIQASTPKANKGPTKTELEYARIYLAGKNARFEGITLRMANGHKYTPDWIWFEDGAIWAAEVKGSYRLGSYQRARLAFDQARLDFPGIRFVWAEKQKDGSWQMKEAR